MNILHLESSMYWGGQEYRTVLENVYLNKRGHRSWIGCHPQSRMFVKGREFGARTVAMNLGRAWRVDQALRLAWFCRKHQVDLIHSHGSSDSTLGLAGYLFGAKLVRSRQITNPVRHIFSYRYGCSHVIAAAHAIQKLLCGMGLPEEHVSVVGEGVDLEEYHPDVDCRELRKEFQISSEDFVVSNIGMIREDKGQIHYVEAARNVLSKRDHVKFFLIGSETGDPNGHSLAKELKARIVEHGLQDRFFMTGYRDDVPLFMALSDVVVIASIGTEAQSRIAPQAFAMKTPVIATRVGGLPELVIDGENGKIVPPADPALMSEAIEFMIDHPRQRSLFAENAYSKALHDLSLATMMEKTLDVYDRVLNKGLSKSGKHHESPGNEIHGG